MRAFVFIFSLVIIANLSFANSFLKVDTTAILAGNDVYYRFMSHYLEKSVDGAKTWSKVELKKGNFRLPFVMERNMIWMDENNGYLFGDDGTFSYAANTLRTFDGGKTWHTFHAENISQSGVRLKTIHRVDANHHFMLFGMSTKFLSKSPKKGIYYAYSNNAGKTWSMNVIKPQKKEYHKKHVRNITKY